ncbi:MAG: phosphomannomutase/phosphoglucomutase [Bdellovibrionia bacterium]
MTIQINPAIFREYDIRGIAGRDLDASFARLLGFAYAHIVKSRPTQEGRKQPMISVGWDCRLTSESYSQELIQGLIAGGVQVTRLGVCPSPLTYFSIFSLNLDGGIMITGSHNPADYNGFKILVGKDTIHGKQIQELRGLMEKLAPQLEKLNLAETLKRLGSEVVDYAIIPKYIRHLTHLARPLKRKRIVVDAGNGTASTVAPELFEALGAEVIPLFCELDGRFPNHHPDPTVPANLKHLIEKVLQTKADFGLAFDGDSDRLGLVDEKGRILFGDEQMILFSRSILAEMPGATIISEVKSSYRLYDEIAKKGGKPIMWKTGHSLIKSKMKETHAALAGEMSGHMFFADRYFGFDDAIYAGLRVYEIASAHSGPLSSLLQDLPVSVSTPEIRVNCEEEKKFQLVEETKKRLGTQNKITDIDGVRVDFGDAWGLVRASNTQPVLVLRFEAPNSPRLKEVRTFVESALHAAAQCIGHPQIEISDGETPH